MKKAIIVFTFGLLAVASASRNPQRQSRVFATRKIAEHQKIRRTQ
jgi:hypothetical protein